MARECEGHGDVYCSDCGATLAAAERDLAEARRERDEARGQCDKLNAAMEAWDRETVVLTQRIESVAHDHAKAIAERDEALAKLAALEALAHDESGFDDHHPSWSTEWAIKEMAQRWAGASAEAEHALDRLASAERVVEASRLLLRMWPHCATCVIVGPPGGPATILKEPTGESCICDPDAKAYRRALRAYDSSGSSEPCLQGESAMPGMPAKAGEQSRVGETTSGDTRPPEPAGTTCVRSDCRGSKVCEAEGCQVIHPNGCSADRTLGGWLCGAHVGVPLEGLARVERDPQAPATLADLDKLREEIAGALDAVTDRRRDWGDCNSDFDWLADAIRKGGAK